MRTIKVTTQEMLNDVLDLRRQIFVDEQGVDPQLEQDQYDHLGDPTIDHFGYVLKENIIVGTARCKRLDDGSVKLGRFSIHPKLRHQGFGIKFLKEIEHYYYQQKVEIIFVHAQKQAYNFYSSAGYEPYGEEFLEADIVHQRMRKRLYQHFYTRFADVYDLIFPLTHHKKHVLNEFVYDKETLLDIGSATGMMSQYIASLNKQVTAIDIDARMVFLAQQKGVNALVTDMAQLNGMSETFDGILCLGNTLVHLSNLEEINQFFEDCYNRLNPNGQLLIQIINYHKVLTQEITQLPTITSPLKNVVLERHYFKNDRFHFNTTLRINKQSYYSSVELTPLTPQQLREIAMNHHFEIVNEYGGYDLSEFNLEESIQFLIKLQKSE